MENLKTIRTFVDVVETGGLTQAASKSDVAVSSVARQIRALEEELGTRLLDRARRPVALTDAGQIFYQRSLQLIRDFETAKSDIGALRDDVKGILRVALRIAAGTTIVMPALTQFLDRYPELELDITFTDKRLNFAAERIDVALWLGNLPDADIIASPLGTARRVLCGAPSYFEQFGTPSQPADLKSHNCLCYTAPGYGSRWVFSDNGRDLPVDVRGSIRADNGVALLSAALMGAGLIVTPLWMARDHITRGTLVTVLDKFTIKPHPNDAIHHAVFPVSHRNSAKTRAFVDFLKRAFSDFDNDHTGTHTA